MCTHKRTHYRLILITSSSPALNEPSRTLAQECSVTEQTPEMMARALRAQTASNRPQDYKKLSVSCWSPKQCNLGSYAKPVFRDIKGIKPNFWTHIKHLVLSKLGCKVELQNSEQRTRCRVDEQEYKNHGKVTSDFKGGKYCHSNP